MKSERSSLTALAVACARGIPRRGGEQAVDALAEHVVPEPWASAVRAGRELAQRAPWLGRMLPIASCGLVDHLALRTRAIDEVVERWSARHPALQLVIVGAGFDTRAHRLDCLRSAQVFELDFLATAMAKASRIGELPVLAAGLHRLPIDFERERPSEVLRRAGHRTDRPTLWIWEGVTMYLTRDAVEATLADLAQVSAPGSGLAMTYATPRFQRFDRLGVVLRAFEAIGEPLRTLLQPRQAASLVHDRGFSLVHDEGFAEWARRFGRGGLSVLGERLLVAERP